MSNIMAEQINEVVSDGKFIEKSEKINVSYFRPSFLFRVLANLIDLLILALVFVSGFLGVREIIKVNPTYKAKSNELIQIRLDSGVYAYDDDNVLRDIVSVLNYDKGQTAKSRSVRSRNAIDKFISYAKEVATEEKYNIIVDDYYTYRLSKDMNSDGKPLFVIDSNNEVVENPELLATVESVSSPIYKVFYEKAYKPFIDEHIQGYLVTSIPHYYDIVKYQTNILMWVNIFAVYAVSGILVYIVPIFIFRRGRKTIGKAVYGIGLVDANCLCPSMGRTLARFAIFYFAIYLASLFLFGLPMIISFSLMAFSKKKQGFPDYMMNLQEIDAKRTKIYFSFQEAELENISTYKKPVNFTTRNFD